MRVSDHPRTQVPFIKSWMYVPSVSFYVFHTYMYISLSIYIYLVYIQKINTYDKLRVWKSKYITLPYSPYSQSYGFSSSHGRMWKFVHKEGWVLQKWCFQIEALEKTLESPLDCKEIKPINPKRNPPWIFFGMTVAEAEAPIIWPPDAKSQLIRKDPDAGKDWRQKERGGRELDG